MSARNKAVVDTFKPLYGTDGEHLAPLPSPATETNDWQVFVVDLDTNTYVDMYSDRLTAYQLGKEILAEVLAAQAVGHRVRVTIEPCSNENE